MDNKLEQDDTDIINIVLLTDEKLTDLDITVLSQFFNIKIFDKHIDADSKIKELSAFEILIVALDNPLFETSIAMKWLSFNLKMIKKDYVLIYNRTKKYIAREDLDLIQCDYVISGIPRHVLDKKDMLYKLYQSNMPKIKSDCKICFQCLYRFFKAFAG